MGVFLKIVAGGAIGAVVAPVAVGSVILAVIDDDDERSENDFHHRMAAGSYR